MNSKPKMPAKRILKYLLYLLLLMLFFLLLWLNFAQVRLTQGGVYQSLTLPMFNNQGIKLNAFYAAHADEPTLTAPALQGPIIKTDGEQWVIHWFCYDQAHSRQQSQANRHIEIECHGDKHQFQIHHNPTQTNEYIVSAPVQTMVTSDLHGRYDYFITWAQELNIIDDDLNWAFGSSHLVVLGDFVDKGPQVFALLWKLYHLEAQAAAVGGRLHVVLGNHEQYILKGLFTRVAAEQLYAIEQMMPFEQAFAANTVLGSWLRTKPVVIQIGRTLFLHAGVNPSALDQKLTLEQINQSHLDSFTHSSKTSDDLFYSPTSITRYRGYVTNSSRYPKANQRLIDDTLALYNSDYIVAGHTGVDDLAPRYNGKVYVVDNTETSPQSLQFINGQPSIITTQVKKPTNQQQFQQRHFSLFHNNDWQMLWKLLSALKSLNSKFSQ